MSSHLLSLYNITFEFTIQFNFSNEKTYWMNIKNLESQMSAKLSITVFYRKFRKPNLYFKSLANFIITENVPDICLIFN